MSGETEIQPMAITPKAMLVGEPLGLGKLDLLCMDQGYSQLFLRRKNLPTPEAGHPWASWRAGQFSKLDLRICEIHGSLSAQL